MKTNPTQKINFKVYGRSFLERIFKLKEQKTSIKAEVTGGIKAFIIMLYTLAVIPEILALTGMPKPQIFTASCITAAVSTILLGFYGNVPYKLAPSIGLSTYVAYSVCLNGEMLWSTVLAAVLLQGIILIAISITKMKKYFEDAIPKSLSKAFIAGIGLFITYIGLTSSGIIAAGGQNIMAIGNLSDPRAIITILGVTITAILLHNRVKYAVVLGFVSTIAAAWGFALGAGKEYAAEVLGIHIPSTVFGFWGIDSIAMQLNFSIYNSFVSVWSFLTVVTVLLFIGFISINNSGLFTGETEKKVMLSGAIGTVIGAIIGTPTISTSIQSDNASTEGKTGMSAVVTGLIFLAALMFAPIFLSVPLPASCVVMVMLGMLMSRTAAEIDFKNYSEGFPAFLSIVLMPFTGSITYGVIFGTLSYVFLKLADGSYKKVSILMYLFSLIFIIRLLIY